MALQAHQIDGAGHTSSTITVTKTGPMQITLSAGTWTEPDEVTGDPIAMTITQQVLNYTSDPTDPKSVCVMLGYDSGSSPDTEVFSDVIVVDADLMKDASTSHVGPTAPYELVTALVWFEIAANETDLDNTTIHHIEVI